MAHFFGVLGTRVGVSTSQPMEPSICRVNARLQEMIAADTGKAVERVARDINRVYWMSALEAKDYGVIDLIHGQTAATASADLAETVIKVTDEPSASRRNGRH